MHITGLPAGCHLGRPTVADAPSIYRLLAAADTAVIGFPDVTEDDVRDDLTAPGFRPTTDAWLVTGSDGGTERAAMGYAWACRKGTSADVDIDAYLDPRADPALGACLLGLVEQRAGEIGRELGHDTVRTLIGCYRAAAAEAELLAGHGYSVATTFHRMSIALDTDRAEPEIPAGATVRVCGTDEALLRTVHAVKEAAFTGHFAMEPQTFTEWHAEQANRSVTDWSQVWLAEVDGEAAAMLVGNDAFVPTDNAGYVQTLGVHPRARGRGLAKLLLHIAFAEMRRRGRTSAMLGVDTNNVTGALALYESVGMRATMEIDVWQKVIGPAIDTDQRSRWAPE